MVRVVLIVLCLAVTAFLLVRTARELRQNQVDWKGVGLAIGFVLLAVYLRTLTDVGGLV
jgi:hypothetical protein